MKKSQFLTRLQSEREAWEHIVNYVGASRLGIGGVTGRWSVRDIVAFVMAGEQYLADRLHEIQQNEVRLACKTQDDFDTFIEEFGYPDLESPLLNERHVNDLIIHKFRNTPFKDLIELEIHAFDAIIAMVDSLPESRFTDGNLFGRVARYTIVMYRRYIADIQKRFKVPVKR